MNVWLVSPAWGRYSITRLALAQRARLVEQLASRGITANGVIVADDDNLAIAEEFGFHTIEMRNDHLARKVNAGFLYACTEGEADYVVAVGSDDWVHPDYFDPLPLADITEPPLPTADEPTVVGHLGPCVLTGRAIAVVDMVGGKLRVVKARTSMGVIPWAVPRAILQRSGFRPVLETSTSAVRGIDSAMMRGFGDRPNWVYHDPHSLTRVDFKSDTNLTPYATLADKLLSSPERRNPWQLLSRKYGSELANMARTTHEELAAGVAA